jgi:uncharacterized protein YPO0396
MENKNSNPMIDSARRAMTQEQLEEYKKIGEYMYNSVDYKTAAAGVQVRESKDEDLLVYATEALKAGGDPNDLTEPEIQVLNKVYGEKWYERFGFEENEVPKAQSNVVTAADIFADAQKKAVKLSLSRQQRRAMERRMDKDKAKIEKNLKK